MTDSLTVSSGPSRVAVNEATNTVHAANTSEGTVSVIAPAASTPGAPSGVSVTSGDGPATVAFTLRPVTAARLSPDTRSSPPPPVHQRPEWGVLAGTSPTFGAGSGVRLRAYRPVTE